jgi:hypothetical protein
MAKAKTSDDLDGIISEQMDIVSSGKANEEDYKKADIIAKLIGKQLKKDSLRLAYFTAQKKVPPRIESLESASETSKGARK